MPNFNLADYEPVEERLERFYKEHKNGRVITHVAHYDTNTILVRAELFRDFEEDKAWASGIAEETRGEGGMVNKTSHVENCETSAIGRALANAGYAPKGKRPSQEEMKKVVKEETKATSKPATVKPTPGQEKITSFGSKENGQSACVECGMTTSAKVTEFSLSKYGRVLCMKHQGLTA